MSAGGQLNHPITAHPGLVEMQQLAAMVVFSTKRASAFFTKNHLPVRTVVQ